MTTKEIERLKEARAALDFQSAEFGQIYVDAEREPEMVLPTSEQEVTPFVRARTRLYLASWVLPIIDELIGKYDYQTVTGNASK